MENAIEALRLEFNELEPKFIEEIVVAAIYKSIIKLLQTISTHH